MGFWIAIILTYLLVIVGLTSLGYWLPKRKGKRKLGIVLAVLTFLVVTSPITSVAFEDFWYFKSDVTQALEKHNFDLNDEFELKSHRIIGFMDYYEEFTIEISETDKMRLINQIESSNDFTDRRTNQSIADISEFPMYSEDENENYIMFYRNEWGFGYSFYKPNKQGYSPTEEIITISAESNELTYKLIYD